MERGNPVRGWGNFWWEGTDSCGENDVAMVGRWVDVVALRWFRRPCRGGVVLIC